LPSYVLFRIFDPLLRGYTTVHSLKDTLEGELVETKLAQRKCSNERKQKKL
jgi:hypothetical protein